MSLCSTSSRLLRTFVGAMVLVGSSLAIPDISLAADPVFQLPFPCDEVWRGSTYDGHGLAIDFDDPATAENDSRAVLASASGDVVSSSFEWSENGQVRLSHPSGWQTVYAHLDDSLQRPTGHIEAGEVLGYIDPTPNPAYVDPDDYAHLHYEQKDVEHDIVQSRFNGQSYTYGTNVTSKNCIPTADGFADDLVFGHDAGNGTVDVKGFAFYGPDDWQATNVNVSEDPARVGDRMFVTDMDNNGEKDLTFIAQTIDNRWIVRTYTQEGQFIGTYLNSQSTYVLANNAGREVFGDFDDDGFVDDLVMAKDNGSGGIDIRWYKFNQTPLNFDIYLSTLGVSSSSVGDRMFVSDMDQSGQDDLTFVYQTAGNHWAVRARTGAGNNLGFWLQSSNTYDLTGNGGRELFGDFDDDGYVNDLVMAKEVGDTLELKSFRFGKYPEPNNIWTSNNQTVPEDPDRVADRMLVSDLQNGGGDEVTFIAQTLDNRWIVRSYSDQGQSLGTWLNSDNPYFLSTNGGRQVFGDLLGGMP